MKKAFKKIFASAILLLLATGMLLPANYALAQDVSHPLIISAGKSGNDIYVTAKTYNLGNKSIVFSAIPSTGVSFTSADGTNQPLWGKCQTGDTTPSNYVTSCSVYLKINNSGTYSVSASTNYNGTLDSNTINVAMGADGTVTINNCSTGETPDKNGVCVPATSKGVALSAVLPNKGTTLAPGLGATVTAALVSTDGEAKTFKFFTNGNGTFQPATCDVPAVKSGQSQSCSVVFGSMDEGTYMLNANVYKKGDLTANGALGYPSHGVEVTVKSPYAVNINGSTASPESCARMSPPKAYDSATNQCVATTNMTYTPLVGLPGMPAGQPYDTSQKCAFGDYFNIVFKAIIGLCAVLAMVMLVYGGIEYMTGGTISEKENGKGTITNAILGLLIVLGSYALLNTLNPQLLNVCLQLQQQTVVVTPIQEFEITGAQSYSFNAAPIKINFDKDAYPAAKAASLKTGVKISLILAIFQQETNYGKNVGGCRYNDVAAQMKPTEQTIFERIMKDMGKNPTDVPVSCALKSGGGYAGHGGAMGLAQALPSTWQQYETEAKSNLGKSALDPWNPNDALMFIGVFMKHNGGLESPYNGACKYFGQCSFGGVDYASQVVGKMASLDQQIADEIKKGQIN